MESIDKHAFLKSIENKEHVSLNDIDTAIAIAKTYPRIVSDHPDFEKNKRLALICVSHKPELINDIDENLQADKDILSLDTVQRYPRDGYDDMRYMSEYEREEFWETCNKMKEWKAHSKSRQWPHIDSKEVAIETLRDKTSGPIGPNDIQHFYSSLAVPLKRDSDIQREIVKNLAEVDCLYTEDTTKKIKRTIFSHLNEDVKADIEFLTNTVKNTGINLFKEPEFIEFSKNKDSILDVLSADLSSHAILDIYSSLSPELRGDKDIASVASMNCEFSVINEFFPKELREDSELKEIMKMSKDEKKETLERWREVRAYQQNQHQAEEDKDKDNTAISL